jgi:hypothetical protein
MGASLRLMGQFTESLEIIEAGLTLFPNYRPLRAYHMFALHSAGFHQNAMLESLKLMLESLAPTKWDVYEDDIIAIVKEIRERVPSPDTSNLADWEFDEFWGEEVPPKADDAETDEPDDDSIIAPNDVSDDAPADETPTTEIASKGDIPIEEDNAEDESFEIQVKIVNRDDTKPKASPKKGRQFGKKPVKIDIHNVDEDQPPQPTDEESESDDDAPTSGKIDIPIDLD